MRISMIFFFSAARYDPITRVPLVFLWSQTYRERRAGGLREQKHSRAAELWPSLPPSPDSTPEPLTPSPKKHTRKNQRMIQVLQKDKRVTSIL